MLLYGSLAALGMLKKADRTGLRRRERPTSTSQCSSERKRACESLPVLAQQGSAPDRCRVRPAQLWAAGYVIRNTKAAGIFSTTRAKRNQVVSGIFLTSFSSTLPRSTAISPKPPFWSRMSAALNACSRGLRRCFIEQRTQRTRARFTHAASADSGSKQSPASTSAQNCSRRVSCAIRETSSAVLPDDELNGA